MIEQHGTTTARRWPLWGVRLFRLGLLAAVVWLLRSGREPKVEALDVSRVRDFFPDAAEMGAPDASAGLQAVRDASGQVLGLVAQTLPEASSIIGYAGPSNVLIAMDSKGAIIGLRLLQSEDTPDHVAEVVKQRKFFSQFKDRHLGDTGEMRVDGVSGATLTSSAIAEGVRRKLGTRGPSLRFPDEITLAEVKDLDANAKSLRLAKAQKDRWEVLDGDARVIGIAVRTSPVADGVVGYKGPSDTLLLLDAAGIKVRGIRLRKSYDTKRYVGYVTDDSYFLHLFNGMSVNQLATLDFKAAKIEGVSGATETSWAVAEGLKRRAGSLQSDIQSEWGLASLTWRWRDSGHLFVVISAAVMAFTSLRGLAWARLAHHILMVGYVGFYSSEMLSQSLFVGWARHGVPWRQASGLVMLGMVALLAPVFTRRQLYCHHICPHGALQQLVARRLRWQLQVPRGLNRWLEKAPYLLLGVVVFSAALQLGLDLNGIEPFDAYAWRIAGGASLVIALAGLVASFFVPLAYCRYGCPTGAVFKILRYSGDGDQLGRRDWLALTVVVLAAGAKAIVSR